MHCLNLFAIILLVRNCDVYANDALNENSNETTTNSTQFHPITTTNFTQVREQYSSKISNYCMSTDDFEELYGNKSLFGLVILFISPLISTGYKQIGQNELRRHFCLKAQQISFTDPVEEEPDECNFTPTLPKQIQEHFQEKIYLFNKDSYLSGLFRPEEIGFAEKFLNKKFPEIRQLFRLKYQQAAGIHHQKKANKELIDKVFDSFTSVQSDIFWLSKEMITQSAIGILMDKSSRCYKSFF